MADEKKKTEVLQSNLRQAEELWRLFQKILILLSFLNELLQTILFSIGTYTAGGSQSAPPQAVVGKQVKQR